MCASARVLMTSGSEEDVKEGTEGEQSSLRRGRIQRAGTRDDLGGRGMQRFSGGGPGL